MRHRGPVFKERKKIVKNVARAKKMPEIFMGGWKVSVGTEWQARKNVMRQEPDIKR